MRRAGVLLERTGSQEDGVTGRWSSNVNHSGFVGKSALLQLL